MATQTQTQTQTRPNGVVTAQGPNTTASTNAATTSANTTSTDGAPESSQSAQEWDEAAHIEALRLLISLQDKITDMRVAIPNLINPLARATRTTHPTPAVLERLVARRATALADEMMALQAALQAGEAQRVLARARERSDGAAGEEGWEVVVGRPRWVGAEGVDGLGPVEDEGVRVE